MPACGTLFRISRISSTSDLSKSILAPVGCDKTFWALRIHFRAASSACNSSYSSVRIGISSACLTSAVSPSIDSSPSDVNKLSGVSPPVCLKSEAAVTIVVVAEEEEEEEEENEDAAECPDDGISSDFSWSSNIRTGLLLSSEARTSSIHR